QPRERSQPFRRPGAAAQERGAARWRKLAEQVPLALGTERPLDPFDPAARLADLDLVETDGGIEKGDAQAAPIGELFGGFQFRLVRGEAVRRAARSESGEYARLARFVQLLPHPAAEALRDDSRGHRR